MKYLTVLLSALLLTVAASAQESPNNVEFFNPSGISQPHGYSHTAIIDLGTCRMVIISGQVPLDKSGNLVGKDDIGIQTGQVFLNIKTILDELRGNMSDIVKLGYFVTDAMHLLRSCRPCIGGRIDPKSDLRYRKLRYLISPQP